jgi:transcription initiation factor TFIIA large subunit
MLKVTDLPWDPKPAPAVKEQSVPANVKPPLQTLPSNGNINAGGSQSSLNTIPPIKSEAGTYPQQPQQSNYAAPSFPSGQMTAQQRAAMNLHNSYGDRAGPQIAELQQGGQRHGLVPQQVIRSGPHIKQEDTSSNQYHSNISQQAAPIKSDQTDGGNDARDTWQSEYARRKTEIAENRDRNDRVIRDHVLASQQQLEGGGVMLPLDEHVIIGSRSHGRVPKSAGISSSLARAQGDAAGDEDEDEEDENAINSDLDDPNELEDDAADGEDTTDQVMLCTYDKVQRVKNKWKCTLKDGILRVDGSEILFHKGSGEFEW